MRLFISYSSADEAIVNRISQDLALRNIDYWRDVKEIRVGDSITARIEEGLQTSTHFCLCLSKSSVTRQWVTREYRAALNLQLAGRLETIRILPLLLESCDVPVLLRDIRYADFTQSYVAGLQELLDALNLPGSLAKVHGFDVPYEAFINHVEGIETLESFLEAARRKERSDLDHEWACEMFSLLEQGIRSSKTQVEYILGLGTNKIDISTDKESILPIDRIRLVVSPRVCVESGFSLLFDDMVDPYVQAREGFWEFLEKLILFRAEIQTRRVFLLPKSYVSQGESYPDGSWQDIIDNDPLLLKIHTQTI